MRIWWDNEWDKYTLTASSEAAGYAAANTQDYQLAKVTHTVSEGATITWDLDAGDGNTISINAVSILNHNITSDASAIQFVMSANSDYSAASTSVVFTHAAGSMFKYITTNAERYARFLVRDVANSDEYVEVGRFFITSYLQLVGGVGIDFPYQIIDSSTGRYSITGQYFGDEGEVLDLYNFHNPYINNALKGSLITMFETVKTVKPIVMDFNESAHSSIAPLYCKFNDNLNFNHIPVGVADWDFHWNIDFSLKEVR